jgi:hypothetical protein
MDNITQEQKLDYIYETLKKQEVRQKRQTLVKWIFRALLLVYAIYAYKVMFPYLKETLIGAIKPDIGIDAGKIKDLLNY